MSRYKRVPLAELTVDPSYQRVLDETRVNRIVEHFNPALLGTLEVSRRNGKCAVFDGQHRLAALRSMQGVKDAPCLVHEGLGVSEEAMLFVSLQTQRKALKPIERFKARLVAGEDQALKIAEIAYSYGYSIEQGGHAKQIGAVSALDRVWERGRGELLDKTLALLTTWQGEPRSTDGALIEGLGIAIQRFGADKRWGGIEAALEAITATSLLRKAIAALEMGGGSGSRAPMVAKEVGKLVGIRGPYKKRAKAATA